MSLLELKQKVTRISSSERRELGAYLIRLRNESPEWRARMQDRMRQMDDGATVSLEEVNTRLKRQDGQSL
ncbi:MAG: hypothetical protein JJT96_20805 [Opitutales bacterium]|nr:hypothetical protein [Opitutales bacterium]